MRMRRVVNSELEECLPYQYEQVKYPQRKLEWNQTYLQHHDIPSGRVHSFEQICTPWYSKKVNVEASQNYGERSSTM